MIFRFSADLTALIHLAFVLFVVIGGFLVMRWPRLMWVHLPAAVWGMWIEFSGKICPLTPLENYFRRRGGESGYAGEFIEHYVYGLLYPSGLTRTFQQALGLMVLALNVVVYWWIFRNRLSRLRTD